MGFRDELRKRIRKSFKDLVKRAIDFADEEETEQEEKESPVQQEEKPKKKPKQKKKSEKKKPKKKSKQKPPKKATGGSGGDGGDGGGGDDDGDDTMPGSGGTPGNLLQQLAESTAQSNDIVRRLTAMGQGEKAREIVNATVGPLDPDDLMSVGIATTHALDQMKKAMKTAIDALKDKDNKLTSNAKRLLTEAESLAKSAEQAARDAQDAADEITKKAEEIEKKYGQTPEEKDFREYDWDRKPIIFPYQDIDTAFQKLVAEWKKLAIGVKRKNGVPVGPSPFAPRIKARGAAVSLPQKIPLYALQTPKAFRIWCEDNGFADGLSMEIDGFITGRTGTKVVK